LAQKLNEIKKKSVSIQQLEGDKELKLTIVGKGNKVYLLVFHEEFKEKL